MKKGNHKLALPRTIVNQLLHQAQQHDTQEVCGLIAASDAVPTRCYPVTNVAANPVARYEMDPRQQIEAMRSMRESGEQLFAIYHSHPYSEARPSVTDIAEANYPDAVYLIISLSTKGVLEMRAYRIENRVPRELELTLEES